MQGTNQLRKEGQRGWGGNEGEERSARVEGEDEEREAQRRRKRMGSEGEQKRMNMMKQARKKKWKAGCGKPGC